MGSIPSVERTPWIEAWRGSMPGSDTGERLRGLLDDWCGIVEDPDALLERVARSEDDAPDGSVIDSEATLARQRESEGFAELGRLAREREIDTEELDSLVRSLASVLPASAGERIMRLRGLAVGASLVTLPAGGEAGPRSVLDPALGKILRHDIKTPLQAASLNLELLALEQEGNVEVTSSIDTIQQSLDAAVGMLQHFEDV